MTVLNQIKEWVLRGALVKFLWAVGALLDYGVILDEVYELSWSGYCRIVDVVFHLVMVMLTVLWSKSGLKKGPLLSRCRFMGIVHLM